jgi:RimJ/RimL family protein N-acetyltransferase
MNNILIETKRLLLRPIQIEDAELIFKYRSDSITNLYQGWIPKNITDVFDFINNGASSVINIPGTWFQLVILKVEDSKLIGDIGIHFIDPEGLRVELGCTLDKDYFRNGFATEALIEIIDFLFNTLIKHRIETSIDPRNTKSIRLVERIGLRRESLFPKKILLNNEWVDDLVYIITREEWNNEKHTAVPE